MLYYFMGNLEFVTTPRMFGSSIPLRSSPLKPAYQFLINRKKNKCENQHDEAKEKIVGNVFACSPGLLKENCLNKN